MGLAQFLAEQGLLPMYGMPTRVRELYLSLEKKGEGNDAEFYWSAMGRDLEMAIFEFAPGSILVKDKQKHMAIGFTGTLLEPQERRGRPHLGPPAANWFSDEVFVGLCPACGSAKHEQQTPANPVACDDCKAEVFPDVFKRYVTPSAFRTDFRPAQNDLNDQGQMALRTIATICRRGQPMDVGNIRVHHGAGTMIMHLNDGVEDQEGNATLFNVDVVQDNRVSPRHRPNPLPQQAIQSGRTEKQAARWTIEQADIGPFGLVARKETDAIYLESINWEPQLAVDLVAKRGDMSRISVRAAAISATQLLVQRAALELDVAPDEFEALEPRLRGQRPMLQIADTLINGSGLCRRLGERRSDGKPEIVHLAETIVLDAAEWPLKDLLKPKHRARCATSCYQCIQHFQNRRYHALLDWRLGVAYLRSMLFPEFLCGLDGNYDGFPELAGWLEYGHALARSVAEMRRGYWRADSVKPHNLPCIFEIDARGRPTLRAVIVHPLWRVDAGARFRLIERSHEMTTRFVDTFDLERRPLRAMERAFDRPPDPDPILPNAVEFA